MPSARVKKEKRRAAREAFLSSKPAKKEDLSPIEEEDAMDIFLSQMEEKAFVEPTEEGPISREGEVHVAFRETHPEAFSCHGRSFEFPLKAAMLVA